MIINAKPNTSFEKDKTTLAKEQLNNLLVLRDIAENVDAANRRIMAKEVKVDDCYITSPSARVSASAEISVKESCAYVSRGGTKLKAAIDAFAVSVAGKNCLDIGASTGGFSDCMLQEGAARVACVDVNYGQLAWKIRTDARTCVFERTNIKNADAEELGAPFDVVTIDVSFIGLAQLAPVIARFCYNSSSKKTTELLALVKPEFEACAFEVEGGRVSNDDVHTRCVNEVKSALQKCNFEVIDVIESPIRGKKKGNKEFLLYAKR